MRRLPRARRGGRRGPLTKEQAHSQRIARLSGVCIRCQKTKIKCTGGIPCTACRATTNSRIWKKPCTRAQFLDIVESGSYFPSVAAQEIMAIETKTMRSFLVQLSLIDYLVKAEKSANLTQFPLKTKFVIPWSVGKESIGSVLLGILNESGAKIRISSKEPTWPSTSKFISVLNLMANNHPFGQLVQSDADVSRPGSPTWTQNIIIFCMACPYFLLEDQKSDEILFPLKLAEAKQEYLRDATVTLTWIAARYLELCLFRYLQMLLNNLAERPNEEQKAYIICMFQVLLLNGGITASTLEISSVDANNPYIQTVCQNFLDRQNRLRMALWVYSSIAISKLHPWSNICETLQERWPLLSKRRMAEQFHSSLATFDASTDKKIEPLYESFDFLNEYSSILSEVYDEFSSENLHDESIYSNEEIALYRLVLSDHLSNIRATADQPMTASAFGFEAEEQRKALSVLAFTFLANVKWKAALSKHTSIQDVIQSGKLYLSYLMRRVANRRLNIKLTDAIITKFAKKILIAPDDAIEVITTCFRTIYDAGDEKNANVVSFDDILSRLHIGRRWKELENLFSAEILLLGSPPKLFSQIPSLLLDIPRTVEAASDSQFSELTKIMSTELRWLKETCAKLGGVYGMIQTLDYTNEQEAKTILDQIQSRIHSTFGDSSFIYRVTLKESTFLDPFPLVLTTRLMLLKEPNNTEESKVILDVIIREIAVIYWDGMSLEMKERFRQKTNLMFTDLCFLPTLMKDCTLKAVESLFDAFDGKTGHLGNELLE